MSQGVEDGVSKHEPAASLFDASLFPLFNSLKRPSSWRSAKPYMAKSHSQLSLYDTRARQPSASLSRGSRCGGRRTAFAYYVVLCLLSGIGTSAMADYTGNMVALVLCVVFGTFIIRRLCFHSIVIVRHSEVRSSRMRFHRLAAASCP